MDKNKELKIVNIAFNDRYDKFVVLSDGRVFWKRRMGLSGDNFDKWKLLDIMGELKSDIKDL